MGGELKGQESAPPALQPPPVDWFKVEDLSSVQKVIQTHKQPFDFDSALSGNKRVVFFGERHDDFAEKDAIINHLAELKKNTGLTHIALEMLNSSDMPAVKAYFDGTGSREAVLQHLKDRWSVAPGVPEKYMDLIDAIKEAKLIPLGLDPVGSGHDDNANSLFSERNEHWAYVINEALKNNPAAKVLVYSGRDHVGYSKNRDHANEILQDEYGQKSTVIDFTSPYDALNTIEGKVNKSSADLGLNKNEFFLPLSQSEAVRPCDLILHQAE